MPRIELSTRIAAPIRRVFDLARSIDDHLASMSESRERAIDGVTTGLIELGEHVTWRATHFRIPFTMTSRIVAMDNPKYFVDEQVRGPFSRFRHEHSFNQTDDGTEMRDSIDFASPPWLLGGCADRLVLKRYLTELIRVRNEHIKATAEAVRPTG
jgi:ligand-binding SRPBCC domain-containing protein